MEDTSDIIIVGAGLSGIGAACHLQRSCPDKTYTILEARGASGGTWDQFRYPGIRSDSDMHTLGYEFKPWLAKKSIADGSTILRYIREAADDFEVTQHIRYNHRVVSASWSDEHKEWVLEVIVGETAESSFLRCRFLMMCSGYYNYAAGHRPDFPGSEDFSGNIIEPQHWPDKLDYDGKRIVVIGSGATAVTLLPALAEKAASVVMLQRSPGYVVSMPDVDVIGNFLRRVFSADRAYALTRWKNIQLQRFFYRRARSAPESIRKKLLQMIRKELGSDFDVDTHFTPRYKPWEQRLCLLPNGDLFAALRDGKTSIVTDEIDTFTANGILLKSGNELDADIIVTATGLKLCILGDVQFTVNGQRIDFSKKFTYKSLMFSDVPNLFSTFGYVNASWTLRADIIAEYTCRLINYMTTESFSQCTPRVTEAYRDMPAKPWIENFSSGYIQRSMHLLPKQGDRDPWLNRQDYVFDKKNIRDKDIVDDVLKFRR